jgi:hypothetical protein
MARFTRKELENRAWYFTHKDYKSIVDGKKSVLVDGPRGATLTPLSSVGLSHLRELARANVVERYQAAKDAAFRQSIGLPATPPGTKRG